MTEMKDLIEIPTAGLTEELADRLNGTKTKIKSAIVKDIKSVWKDGVRLPEGQTVDGKVVELETESIGNDEAGNPITAIAQINLKQFNNKWGVSKHEKSKSYKVMKMLKINRLEEAIGKDVVVVKTTTAKGNPMLVISLPN